MVIAVAVALQAQPPRDGAVAANRPMVVTGRVLTEAGDPIPNVRVGLTPQNQGTPVVLTDGRGRFVLNIPAGLYPRMGAADWWRPACRA